MIEKQTSIADDTITITGKRVIWREQTVYVEDGVESEPVFTHREIGPDDDASGESERVQAAVQAARTA